MHINKINGSWFSLTVGHGSERLVWFGTSADAVRWKYNAWLRKYDYETLAGRGKREATDTCRASSARVRERRRDDPAIAAGRVCPVPRPEVRGGA